MELKGRVFGRWTVVGDFVVNAKGERKWLCRCTCGTERYVVERSLKHGGSLSCGCIRKENAVKSLAHDLTGQVFGELTVLRVAEHQRKNGGVWWTCQCACGREYDVPGTLLVTGRRTHCGSQVHKNYYSKDISGQKFNMLTAMYPLAKRKDRAGVMWRCRCDCGNEVDVLYNHLVYCNLVSCGCKKTEHDQNLSKYLTHVNGTSIDILKSKKVPANNTTGARGVYLVKGRYVAKIVFQKKAYFLGSFRDFEEAVQVRKEAEEVLFDGVTEYYDRWKAIAEQEREWAEENPFQVFVEKNPLGGLRVTYLPELDEMKRMEEHIL
ncbi:MAG: hypothetical protein IJ374_10965 [Lachnospiraceae bacterium]|nr:hypothetical protein [Lachnospiraceae bacterium]